MPRPGFKFLTNRLFDIVGIGRNSWDRIGVVEAYPPANVKTEMKVLDQQPGGQVATPLVAAARLGARVRYLGKFGDDAAGRAVRGALGREAIDLSESKVVSEAGNQVSFVVVDSNRKTRNVFSFTDPKLRSTSDDFSFESITSGRILFLGGRNPSDAIGYAREGKQAGCVVVLHADSTDEGIAELLPLADAVVYPEEFSNEMTGERSVERAAQDISQMGPKLVCCTLADRGAIALFEREFYKSPAPDVKVVDTTGAGDVFQGAFLFGLLEDMPLSKLISFSCSAASLKCTGLGAQKNIPTRKEIDRLLKDSGLDVQRKSD